MFINISELNHLKGKPLPVEGELDLAQIAKHHPQIARISPVHFKGEAVRSGGVYQVNGDLSGQVSFRCSKCLDEYPYSFSIPFGEVFALTDSSLELDDENEVNLFSGDYIQLDPVAAEVVLVSLPPVPVCDEACRGLCPECGVNKNRETCECKTERIDPRLAALADWFEQKDN